MSVVVGYIQSNGDPGWVAVQTRELLDLGCHTIRTEHSDGADPVLKPVLNRVCEFLGPGDELVTPSLGHLGIGQDSIKAVCLRLERQGATLRLLEPDVSTVNESGRTIIRALQEEPTAHDAREGLKSNRAVDPRVIQALSDHGFGPSQIARKLGISRMTVWRRLSDEQRA